MIPSRNQIIEASLVFSNLWYAVGLAIMKKAQENSVRLWELKKLDNKQEVE